MTMKFDPDKHYQHLPVVVLVGRPNVGKSTLFNRLVHTRRVITDPTPGVTRDSVGMNTFIQGKPLRLIDTGGFKLEKAAEDQDRTLDALVQARTRETLQQADRIILLLEAGVLTNEDEEFIEFLRPFQDRLLVAVNKTEGGRREQDAWNCLSYGFDRFFMISAEHGDHVADLEAAIIAGLDFSQVLESEEGTEQANKPIGIALLGKPNTGKSTLSNRLTASGASIVSDIPGTTRDVVEGEFRYKNRTFKILDTAGIRRKAKVWENIEYYSVNRAIKAIDQADLVLLVIDAQDGLSDQDKKIAALAHDQGRGIIMVLNKWDTMPQVKNSVQAVQDRIRFLFGKMEYAPIIPVSAKNGTGVDKLLDTALRLYSQLIRHIDTSLLNRALEGWLQEYPPPIGPQTRFKIKYALQVSDKPVKFVFFVSRPHAVSAAYVSYLRNKIRQDLGFSQIPVTIELRSSGKAVRHPKE
ncbi:MAG: ribosome biogenesis GTPase Der [Treponema sp.]|jgi:GTP-binding protein|nr:ribosome biogenesis GTPase Der [Treponema sp.]